MKAVEAVATYSQLCITIRRGMGLASRVLPRSTAPTGWWRSTRRKGGAGALHSGVHVPFIVHTDVDHLLTRSAAPERTGTPHQRCLRLPPERAWSHPADALVIAPGPASMEAVLVRRGWKTGIFKPVFPFTQRSPHRQCIREEWRQQRWTLCGGGCVSGASQSSPRQAERPGTTRSSRSPQELKIEATCFSARAPFGQALTQTGSPSQKSHFIT